MIHLTCYYFCSRRIDPIVLMCKIGKNKSFKTDAGRHAFFFLRPWLHEYQFLCGFLNFLDSLFWLGHQMKTRHLQWRINASEQVGIWKICNWFSVFFYLCTCYFFLSCYLYKYATCIQLHIYSFRYPSRSTLHTYTWWIEHKHDEFPNLSVLSFFVTYARIFFIFISLKSRLPTTFFIFRNDVHVLWDWKIQILQNRCWPSWISIFI